MDGGIDRIINYGWGINGLMNYGWRYWLNNELWMEGLID